MMALVLAGPADLPALAAIHAAAFPAEEAWNEAALMGLMDGGCLVLWHPGLGFIMLRVVLDEAEVITLATRPEARRAGLGRCLVRAAIETCRLNRVASLFLEVSTANTAALALYDDFCFLRVGRRRKYYPDQSDAIVMRFNVSAE